MFENKTDLISISSLGGKKQQINFAVSLSFAYIIFCNIPRKNGNFLKNQISLVKLLFSCQLANQVFIFLLSIFCIKIQRKAHVPEPLFNEVVGCRSVMLSKRDFSTGVSL